jgi:hypothetical protein
VYKNGYSEYVDLIYCVGVNVRYVFYTRYLCILNSREQLLLERPKLLEPPTLPLRLLNTPVSSKKLVQTKTIVPCWKSHEIMYLELWMEYVTIFVRL